MEGYSVDEAGDGEEGLELFFKNNYDIIILDIMMPKLMVGVYVER